MSAVLKPRWPASFVRRAMPGDTWLLLPDIRTEDVTELAALGVTPEQSMSEGMSRSAGSWVQFIHGEPACMYGYAIQSGFAVPWAICTTTVERHPVAFLRESRKFIASLPMMLQNYVDARNTKTVEWLRWLGFTIDTPAPIGINGELFCRFWRCATGGSR